MSDKQTTPTRFRSPRRIFVIAFVAAVLLPLLLLAYFFGPAVVAYWRYAPQEGDIVFQSLPHGDLVDAIEGVSQSPYSHCGIVARKDGRWVVYEALGEVRITPLAEFLIRGRGQGFAVYRLKPEHRQHIPSTLANVQSYLGRPYDARYRLDDERIYCSELIYKSYQTTTGEPLGVLARLGDLNWQPFEETINFFEPGPVPLDRKMITPKDLAAASQLQRVFSFNIAASP